MKQKELQSWLFLVGILFTLAFGWIAYLVSQQQLHGFDSVITQYILSRDHQSTYLIFIMKGFTFLGSFLGVFIIGCITALFIYRMYHSRAELILFIAALLCTSLINEALKDEFKRPRPSTLRLVDALGYSFPSGHSMIAFTLYTFISFLLWPHMHRFFSKAILLSFSIIMIVMIGISRIYLGVHYPSDVLGGFLASGSIFALSILIYLRYKKKII